ncbi:unnamed protein product [Prunus armeniaca]
MNFTTNLADLINEFSAYPQTKKGSTCEVLTGFLAGSNRVPQGDVPGATDHMTNQYSKLYNFESYTKPSLVSITNGRGVPILDLATKKLIGEGHYLNELYYFSKDLNVPKGLPFISSISRASKLFEMVHSDVWGPAPLESFDGYRYYVTFVDDFSRVTWLYLLKFNSEVMDAFKNFHNLVMNHFSSQIHILRYSSAKWNYRKENRDLLEKTRALMLQMNVPKRFWSQGLLVATCLINRLPSRVLDSKSPYEVMRNKKNTFPI